MIHEPGKEYSFTLPYLHLLHIQCRASAAHSLTHALVCMQTLSVQFSCSNHPYMQQIMYSKVCEQQAKRAHPRPEQSKAPQSSPEQPRAIQSSPKQPKSTPEQPRAAQSWESMLYTCFPTPRAGAPCKNHAFPHRGWESMLYTCFPTLLYPPTPPASPPRTRAKARPDKENPGPAPLPGKTSLGSHLVPKVTPK